MRYLCLRDCFVGDRFWKGGETYDIAEDGKMEINEKNFSLVGPSPEPAPAGEKKEGQPEKPKTPQGKPDFIPKGQYWCGKCQTLHRETSKLGKRHLKHKED